VVCGRSKDLIIVAGRNIFPTDIEQAVSAVPGIWRGQVAAFSIEGNVRERVIVMAETDATSQTDVIRNVKQIVMDVAEVATADVCLIEPGTIAKTTSGKISRSGCKRMYLSGRVHDEWT
jgi:acyl-CoA synthetase (AMP-forming)/AMP-acid ligase II